MALKTHEMLHKYSAPDVWYSLAAGLETKR